MDFRTRDSLFWDQTVARLGRTASGPDSALAWHGPQIEQQRTVTIRDNASLHASLLAMA